MPGLIVRTDKSELKWYPFFKHEDRFTFYASKQHGQPETGWVVGRGFDFDEYLVGYWTSMNSGQKRHIGGGDSLVVLESNGNLRFYRFEGGTFMVSNTGKRVGRGFNAEWDYYVAEWTSNGTSDLLVRDDAGNLRLFPWDGQEFRDLGRAEQVGQGFTKEKFPDLLPGYWRGGPYPDLVARENNGNLWLYPFDGRTFRGQGNPVRIGRGFDNRFTHYLVDEWAQNGSSDLVVRHKNGNLVLYEFQTDQKGNYSFLEPYPRIGRGFKDNWQYLAGHWREPGKPDLIICDDGANMRFYPFLDKQLVDLPKDQREVGKGWKFSHYFIIYSTS